jgi:sugar O-acyltransferase (sialic acid O-acetyltransferase NeuD family)
MKSLVIIGAGGVGQEVFWAAVRMNTAQPQFTLCGFCDDAPGKQTGNYRGVPLLGSIELAAKALDGEVYYVCGVGDNRRREELAMRAERCGWLPVAIIDPSVLVAPDVEIGAGSYIAAMTVLSPCARIGRHVLINTGCSIGHNAVLGDFVQVCPGARVSGGATVGRFAFIGSNAVVAPFGVLEAGAILGAGSFALRPIPADATAVGNPARVVFKPVAG